MIIQLKNSCINRKLQYSVKFMRYLGRDGTVQNFLEHCNLFRPGWVTSQKNVPSWPRYLVNISLDNPFDWWLKNKETITAQLSLHQTSAPSLREAPREWRELTAIMPGVVRKVERSERTLGEFILTYSGLHLPPCWSWGMEEIRRQEVT